jgi:glutamate 5-kinase
VAAKVDADHLFILTDVDGLLTSTGADGQPWFRVFHPVEPPVRNLSTHRRS